MSRFLLMLLFFLVALPSAFIAQTKKNLPPKLELPIERFFRKGGKETKAKVTWDKHVGLTTTDIAQGRNLALYDSGGFFDCGGFGASMGEGELEKCDNARIWGFVWSHWQNKVKGYLVITGNSVDAVSTSHIFVEPGRDGKWHVAWRIVRHTGGIDDMPDVVKVEKAKTSDPFILIFRDEDGDEVQTLPWR